MFRAAEDVYHTPALQQRFLPLTPISGDRDEPLRTRSDISSVKAADSLKRADATERIELFGKDDAYRRRFCDPSFLNFNATPGAEDRANDIYGGFQSAAQDQLDEARHKKRGGDDDNVYPERTATRRTGNDFNPSDRFQNKDAPTAHHGHALVTHGALMKNVTTEANVHARFQHGDDLHVSEESNAMGHARKGDWEDEEDVITPVPQTGEERKGSANNTNLSDPWQTKEQSTACDRNPVETPGAFVKYETTKARVNEQVQHADDLHMSERNDATQPAVKWRLEDEEDVITAVPETNREVAQNGGEHLLSDDVKRPKRKKGRKDMACDMAFLDNDEIAQSAEIASSSHGGETDEPEKPIVEEKVVKKEAASKHKRQQVAKHKEKLGTKKLKRSRKSAMNEVLRLQKSLETARWTNARAVREQTEVIIISDRESPTVANDRGANRRTARRASTGSRYMKKEKVTSSAEALTRSESYRRKARSETKRPNTLRTRRSSTTARPVENVNADETVVNTVTRTTETRSSLRKAENASPMPEAVTARNRLGKRTRASIGKEDKEPVEREEDEAKERRPRGHKTATLPNNVSGKRRRSARILEGALVKEVSGNGNGTDESKEVVSDEGMNRTEKQGKGPEVNGMAKCGEPRRDSYNVLSGGKRRRGEKKGRGTGGNADRKIMANEEEEVSSADEIEWNMREDEWVRFVKAWVVEGKVERRGWETVKADEVRIFMGGEFGLGERALELIPELWENCSGKTARDAVVKRNTQVYNDTERTDSEGLSSEDIVRKQRVRRR